MYLSDRFDIEVAGRHCLLNELPELTEWRDHGTMSAGGETITPVSGLFERM
jgi:hypothetical protein